jgi:hypothetical protein
LLPERIETSLLSSFRSAGCSQREVAVIFDQVMVMEVASSHRGQKDSAVRVEP